MSKIKLIFSVQNFYLILLLIFSCKLAYPCDKKMQVAFYTGIRYIDGFGDVALNKYVIDNQIKKLKSIKSPCYDIHVVFLKETKKTMTLGNNYQYGDVYAAVRKIFSDGYESITNKILIPVPGTTDKFESNGKITEGKVTYWRQDEFESFIKKNPLHISLALMASDTSDTLIELDYKLPNSLTHNLNLVSFLEYRPLMSGVRKNKVELVEDLPTGTLDIRVPTGMANDAIILPVSNKNLDKSYLVDLIKSQKKVKTIWGSTDIIDSNLDWGILASYFSRHSETQPQIFTRLLQQLIFGYLESKKHNKKFVVFSNHFPIFFQGHLTDSLADFIEKAKEELIVNDWPRSELSSFSNFLKNDVLFLGPGSQSLSPSEMAALFNPKNDSLFPYAAGFATLGDILSVNNFPLYQARDYHVSIISELQESLLDRENKQATKIEYFLQKIYSMNEKSGYEFLSELLNIYNDNKEYFLKQIIKMKKEKDISLIIEDTISLFSEAFQKDPNNTAHNVLSKLFTDNVETPLSDNKLLKRLKANKSEGHNLNLNFDETCYYYQLIKLLQN